MRILKIEFWKLTWDLFRYSIDVSFFSIYFHAQNLAFHLFHVEYYVRLETELNTFSYLKISFLRYSHGRFVRRKHLSGLDRLHQKTVHFIIPFRLSTKESHKCIIYFENSQHGISFSCFSYTSHDLLTLLWLSMLYQHNSSIEWTERIPERSEENMKNWKKKFSVSFFDWKLDSNKKKLNLFMWMRRRLGVVEGKVESFHIFAET